MPQNKDIISLSRGALAQVNKEKQQFDPSEGEILSKRIGDADLVILGKGEAPTRIQASSTSPSQVDQDKGVKFRQLTRSEMLDLLKKRNIHWGVANKNRFEMVRRWESYLKGEFAPGDKKHFKLEM